MNRPLRLLFASWHCPVDPSSGAALATRDLLELLAGRGWDCRIFAGPLLDFDRGESPAQLLADQRIGFERKRCGEGPVPFSLLHFQTGGVRGAVYLPESAAGGSAANPDEQMPFLALFERTLERERPDLLLTWGGRPPAEEILRTARRHGVPVVFALHNFAYRDARFFEPADAVLVPSRFSADYHRETLGIECKAIASPLNWSRVRCEQDPHRRYVTFINPTPGKGALIFARIAKQLGRRRPEIPLLVVEGRSGSDWLPRSGVDLTAAGNVHRMTNTPDPRDFYRVSRMILIPSVAAESFGRVAAEAQINGIPVLVSDRGALPEVVGDAGFVLPLPGGCTPDRPSLPTAEEVAGWVETIIRLWDDDALHARCRRRALQSATRWHPDTIAAEHEELFRGLVDKELAQVEGKRTSTQR